MQHMNVLFFTHYAEMYGANYSTLYLMQELKNKYNITPFLIIPTRGSIIKKLRENDIDYLCVRFKNWMINNDDKSSKLQAWMEMECTNQAAIKSIRAQLKKMNFTPQVVISASSMMNIGLQYAMKEKKKHLWFIRECNGQYGFSNIYPNSLARLWWKSSDRIICISKFALNEFQQTYGVIGNEVVLYNGVATNPKSSIRKQRAKNEKIKFCIVGLISKNKGQYFVTECFQEVYKLGYKNFQLFIVGGGNTLEINKIKNLCKREEFGKNVEILGYCDNVQEILRDMDVGIMSSYKEMFGRTTVEYMMAGMPVIASASGANEEIVEDGKTGFIYTINNKAEFVEKVKYCLQYPEQLKVLGKKGKIKAEKLFTKEKNAEGFNKILRNIINE